MHPRAVHFNKLNGKPLHINDHIKYDSALVDTALVNAASVKNDVYIWIYIR
jgi:hypothetical protein